MIKVLLGLLLAAYALTWIFGWSVLWQNTLGRSRREPLPEGILQGRLDHWADHETVRLVLNETFGTKLPQCDETMGGHLDHHNAIHRVVNALIEAAQSR